MGCIGLILQYVSEECLFLAAVQYTHFLSEFVQLSVMLSSKSYVDTLFLLWIFLPHCNVSFCKISSIFLQQSKPVFMIKVVCTIEKSSLDRIKGSDIVGGIIVRVLFIQSFIYNGFLIYFSETHKIGIGVFIISASLKIKYSSK